MPKKRSYCLRQTSGFELAAALVMMRAVRQLWKNGPAYLVPLAPVELSTRHVLPQTSGGDEANDLKSSTVHEKSLQRIGQQP
jgi:hypothetical protein